MIIIIIHQKHSCFLPTGPSTIHHHQQHHDHMGVKFLGIQRASDGGSGCIIPTSRVDLGEARRVFQLFSHQCRASIQTLQVSSSNSSSSSSGGGSGLAGMSEGEMMMMT